MVATAETPGAPGDEHQRSSPIGTADPTPRGVTFEIQVLRRLSKIGVPRSERVPGAGWWSTGPAERFDRQMDELVEKLAAGDNEVEALVNNSRLYRLAEQVDNADNLHAQVLRRERLALLKQCRDDAGAADPVAMEQLQQAISGWSAYFEELSGSPDGLLRRLSADMAGGAAALRMPREHRQSFAELISCCLEGARALKEDMLNVGWVSSENFSGSRLQDTGLASTSIIGRIEDLLNVMEAFHGLP